MSQNSKINIPRRHLVHQVKIISLLIDNSSSTKKVLPKMVCLVNELLSRLSEFEHVRVLVSVSFFGTNHRIAQDFIDVKRIHTIECPSAFGCTNMGRALISEVNRTIDFYKQYKAQHADQLVFPPSVYMLTDGRNDAGSGASEYEVVKNKKQFQDASSLIRNLESDNPLKADQLNFYAIGLQNALGSAVQSELQSLTRHSDHVLTVSNSSTLVSLFNTIAYWTSTSFR